MKCSVCKLPVAHKKHQTSCWVYQTVAVPHPKKNGKGLCDGSGLPEDSKKK